MLDAADAPSRSSVVTPRAAEQAPPLCVDLDLTLLRTDMLYETLALLVRQRPRDLLRLPFWLMRGKAALKREIAQRVEIDYGSLPFNEELVAWIGEQRAAGRRTALVSASDQILVDGIAAHLDLFDVARGSDGTVNLSGRKKLAAMQELYGERLTYAGDHGDDLVIFEAAESAVLVGDVAGLEKALAGKARIERRFPVQQGGARTWLKELRPHQWSKNGLALAPVLLSGPLATSGDFVASILAVLMLCLLASAGYVFNDLLDLEADRRHPTKRARPFAAARLKVRDGLLAVPILVVLAFLVVLPLSGWVALVGLAYFATTLTYSLHIKRIPMLDVLVLAGLFTVRLLAGMMATAEPISFWLLSFSMFIFLSLAIVKRYAELHDLMRSDAGTFLAHRGYSTADLQLLLALGVASTMSACGIFIIYLINEQFPSGIYGHPGWLWLVFPVLLYWLLRIWHLTVQGRMNQDPVLFAVRDKVSLGLGALTGLLVLLAW